MTFKIIFLILYAILLLFITVKVGKFIDDYYERKNDERQEILKCEIKKADKYYGLSSQLNNKTNIPKQPPYHRSIGVEKSMRPSPPDKKVKFKMYHDLTVYPRKTYYQCSNCGSYNVTQLNIYAAGLLASTTDIKCDDCFAVHDKESCEDDV